MNVWGHLSGSFGLGAGARCTVRALEAAGIQVYCHDLPLATHVNDEPVEGAELKPAAIDLIHTNPNVLRQTDSLTARIDLAAPLRIGFWAWELEDFPAGWEAGFAGLDQIWCPSAFTASSLGLRSPIPVTPLPHLIDWQRADRLRALRQTAPGSGSSRPRPFTCLFPFDFWSTQARKNPHGVIDAFQLAFPRRRPWGSRMPEARLVLKLASSEQFPEATAALKAKVATDERIQLICEHLSREAFDRLMAEADALVSLHRAEGFGLALAEAMAAELPVVATGYSGNLDFMPPGSAELVPYRLVPIHQSEGDYQAGWHWAEPDIDTAASMLRRLANDAAHHRSLATSGRFAVERMLGPRRIAAIATQRLGVLLRWAGRAEILAALPAGHRLRQLEG